MKLYKIQWPTAAIVIAGTAAITLVLLLAPEDVRGELAGGVGALFLAAAGWADRLLKADQS